MVLRCRTSSALSKPRACVQAGPLPRLDLLGRGTRVWHGHRHPLQPECYADVRARVVAFLFYALSKAIYDSALHAYLGETVRCEERGRTAGLVELSWFFCRLFGVPAPGRLCVTENHRPHLREFISEESGHC